MTLCWIFLKLIGVGLILVILITFSSTVFVNPLYAITISTGEPFKGNLINGVKFPQNLHGYRLGHEHNSYTTPEVIGTLLDALEIFGKKYPDSCDIFIGDFSRQGGGRLKGHESHQNGRDVDIGLFAKGNSQLEKFLPMDSKTLDIAKTWHMIQSLLLTQGVQKIYLDRTIQSRLYQYALSEGVERDYLSRVFGDVTGRAGKECIMEHTAGHRNHMHVRFFAHFSTLAGKIKNMDTKTQMMISDPQLSCLPQRFNYYVKESDTNLNQIAVNLGVRSKELCKWNSLSGSEVPRPGECMVFYKRGTDPKFVQSAGSLTHNDLDEGTPASLPAVRLKQHGSYKKNIGRVN